MCSKRWTPIHVNGKHQLVANGEHPFAVNDRPAVMTSILTDESVHSRIRTTQKPAARSAFSSWCVGFITNISNPKAVVFFSSLFVVALPADPPLWVRVASFIVMALISLGWYSTVACLFSMEPVIKIYQKAKRGIDYVTGGIFIVLAISIILVR